MKQLKNFWSRLVSETPKNDRKSIIFSAIGASLIEVVNRTTFSNDIEIEMLLHSLTIALISKVVFHAQKVKK